VLPRTLVVDKKEIAWKPGGEIVIRQGGKE
jgi:hypothetical protein